MAPSTTWTQILSTSLQNRTGEVSNNIAKRNALYSYMKKKGNIKKIAGGESIVRPIEYDTNSNYTRYTNAGLIRINPQDIITSVTYPWRQIAMSIQQTGLEDIQNAGKEQVVDLLGVKQRNCERSFVNGMSGDIYSAGTADGGLQVGGLQLLIADDPTVSATVGGLNQSTAATAAGVKFWQNASKTTSSGTGIGFGARTDSTNVRAQFETMYLAGLRDEQNFDLCVSDNSIWQYYTGALRAIQQIGNQEMVKDGILTLKVFGMDYIYDGGADGSAPTARAYFMNTDFLYLIVSSKRDFTALGGNRQPINQDLNIKLLAWAGNMVCTNRRSQAIMIDA